MLWFFPFGVRTLNYVTLFFKEYRVRRLWSFEMLEELGAFLELGRILYCDMSVRQVTRGKKLRLKTAVCVSR